MEITPILPPSDANLDFDLLDCVAVGTEVHVSDDFELSAGGPVPVIEVLNKSKIIFYSDYNSSEEKIFEMSNRSSFVTIDKTTCKLPLVVRDGWQYLCVEMDDLMTNAFGSTFVACREVIIHGSCRVSKIFFQSKKYADVELPAFLRVVA
eukprot:gene4808-6736_t